MRAELIEYTPRFDITLLDRLGRYAFTLFHAHMLAQAAAQPPVIQESTLARAEELSEFLVAGSGLTGQVPSSLRGERRAIGHRRDRRAVDFPILG